MTSASGHPTADKRFEFARQFAERGDHAAAADLIRQALELAPTWPEGRFSLGEALMLAGQKDDAVAAFTDYLALDPADSMGGGARLAALGAADPTAELSKAYVERLFDQYAPRFDKALTQGLKYSAPAHIRRVLDALRPGHVFANCLDLGCGTGLMGAAVRDIVRRMEGIDLSAGMLAEAKRKNIYDALAQASVHHALTREPVGFDLILAADVLVYVGDLAPVMAGAAASLMPGGLFAFTVQKGAEDYRLGTDHRFSHAPDYIKQAVGAARLNLAKLEPGSFRLERNIEVPGLLAVARKD
jgi:predicted TPR repeat methyltransferase